MASDAAPSPPNRDHLELAELPVTSEPGFVPLETNEVSKTASTTPLSEASASPPAVVEQNGLALDMERTELTMTQQLEGAKELERNDSASPGSDTTADGERTLEDSDIVSDLPKISEDEAVIAGLPKLSATESYNQTIKALPPPPEGGFGWFVVVAGFLTCALAGGSDWAFGVYLYWYINEGVFPGASNKTVALVGSVSAGIFGLVGLFAGRLADTWGQRQVVIVGAVLYVLGLVLASFSTELWMLFLSQGLMKGIGASMVYMPPLSLIPQYFDKRRGLATGLVVSGVGMGGFALGPGTQAMLDKWGFRWALRITAGVAAVCFVVVAFAMRSRFPRLQGAPLLDLSKLKMRRFWLAAFALLWVQFGFFTLTYFTPSYSTYIGLTASQGANLVGFLNIFSFVGRIFQGFTADFLGSANTFVICILIAAMCDLVFWPFSRTWSSQVGLVFLYGFFGGGYASTLPVVMVQCFGVAQIGSTLGMVYLFFVPGGLLGPIIAGSIIDSQSTTNVDGTTTINWLPASLWGGLTLLAGAGFSLWLRYDLSKGKTFIRI